MYLEFRFLLVSFLGQLPTSNRIQFCSIACSFLLSLATKDNNNYVHLLGIISFYIIINLNQQAKYDDIINRIKVSNIS